MEETPEKNPRVSEKEDIEEPSTIQDDKKVRLFHLVYKYTQTEISG